MDMTIEVLVFGPAASAISRDRARISLPDGARTEHVLQALAEQHPALRPLLGGARVAVNHAFASRETIAFATDEVALISLVNGG